MRLSLCRQHGVLLYSPGEERHQINLLGFSLMKVREVLYFMYRSYEVMIEEVAMFGKKKVQKKTYDKENQKPVIRCSICTGEQVAGFKNIRTGKFEEVMLIRNESDRRTFMEMYDIDTVSKEY